MAQSLSPVSQIFQKKLSNIYLNIFRNQNKKTYSSLMKQSYVYFEGFKHLYSIRKYRKKNFFSIGMIWCLILMWFRVKNCFGVMPCFTLQKRIGPVIGRDLKK